MGLLYTNNECSPVTNNTLRINAVSGTLTKTYRDSFFTRISEGSTAEHFYFRGEKPSRIVSARAKYGNSQRDYEEEYNNGYYVLEEIVVLQVMLCGDKTYLIEAIDKSAYEAMFNTPIKNEREEKR